MGGAAARHALAGRLQSLSCDLERIGGRERALIGGDDRHHLRPEAGELLPEQIETAIGDGNRGGLIGILVEGGLEQAVAGAARQSARNGALECRLRVLDPARHQRDEQSRGQDDADQASERAHLLLPSPSNPVDGGG